LKQREEQRGAVGQKAFVVFGEGVKVVAFDVDVTDGAV
jgi:hypothetical protein